MAVLWKDREAETLVVAHQPDGVLFCGHERIKRDRVVPVEVQKLLRPTRRDPVARPQAIAAFPLGESLLF